MKEYFTLVRGYGHTYCNSMEEVKAEIEKKLSENRDLNPTLINSTKSTYRTFWDKVVEIETRIYMYKTYYTETFVIYSGDEFDPLSTIKNDIDTLNLRKEWQPSLEKGVKELKDFLKLNGWEVTETGCKFSGEWYIRFQPEDHSDSFTIETEERHLCCKDTINKAFAQQVGVRFMDIDGFFIDILTAFRS